jgi:hypothetical protein
MGRADPGDSHPIMSKWGGAWVVPQPGLDGLDHPLAIYMSSKFFQLLACLKTKIKISKFYQITIIFLEFIPSFIHSFIQQTLSSS